MAEQGSAKQAGAGGQDLDAGKTFEEIFESALNEPDPDDAGAGEGQEAKGDTETGTGEASDTGKTGGTGKQPPQDLEEEGGDPEPAGGTGEPEALSPEDQQFLSGLTQRGLLEAGEQVSQKELGRLKRMYGHFDKAIRDAEGKVKFFGDSNKELSAKLKKAQSAVEEIMKQQTPADKLKGKISKVDRTKLSSEANNLLDDPAMQEVLGVMMGLFEPGEHEAGSEAAPEGGAPGQAGASAEAGKGQSGVPGSEGHQQAPLTEDQQREVIQRNINTVTEKLKDKHPDIGDIYASPEFRKWAEGLSNFELMKVFSADPRAHDEVLTRYKAEREASQATADEQRKQKERNSDLRTHKSGSSAGKRTQSSEDYTPDQIMNDDTAFDDIEAKVRKATVRTG